MVIDLSKCVACQACVTACTTENNVPIPTDKIEDENRSMRWLDMLIYEGHTEFPRQEIRLIPRPCYNCWEAPCIKACPVRATYKDQQGMIAQVYGRCIGCRLCTLYCPYTLRYFNWYRPEHPMREFLNPDVAVRPKGVVERCTFCSHRLIKAREKVRLEGRPVEDLAPEGEFVPACVQACPADALKFGDLDDKSTEVYKLSKSKRAFVLLEDIGAEPKGIYLDERGPL
jgi:molybdopterin-containing oxidoreductase family iron-sulfur binding subunit